MMSKTQGDLEMKSIKVVKNAEAPEPREVLAEAIVRIGEAAEALRKSGLNENAIAILLHAKTAVSMRDIRTVLSGLRQLKAWYCRP